MPTTAAIYALAATQRPLSEPRVTPAPTSPAAASAAARTAKLQSAKLQSRPAATVPIAAPEAPAMVAATSTQPSTASVSWSPVPQADLYVIERATQRTGFTTVAMVAGTETTYNDAGLAAHEGYRYRLTAVYRNASSRPSPVATVTPLSTSSTDLLPPTDLAASNSQPGKVTLTWAGTTFNQAVLIQRSLDGGLTWSDLVNLPGSTQTYTDTVERNTLYAYRLRCSTFTAVSPFTGSVSLLTPPAEVVSLLKTAGSPNSLGLTWTPVPGATSYLIEQSVEGGDFMTVAEVAGGLTSAMIDGLDAGTVYSFQIRSRNAGGASAATSLAAAQTISAAPTGLVAVATSGGVRITFSPVKGATSYVIERMSKGRAFATLAQVPAQGESTPTYLDILATAADKYTYRVKALSDVGESAYSSEAIVDSSAPDDTLPVAATLTTAAGPKNTTLLSFDGSTSTSWVVQRFHNGTWKPFATVAAGTTTASLKLKAGSQTRVRIVATSGGLYGIPSDSINVVPAPTAVKSIKTLPNANPGTVALTWAAPAGADRYRLERSTDRINWELIDEDFPVAGYVDDTLEPGQSYSYRVSAGNETGFAAPSKPFLLITAPTSPVNLVFSNNILTWDDVAGETTYRLQGSVDGLNWSNAGSTKADITTLTVKSNSKFSFFRVAATNKAGTSPYSDLVTTTLNTTSLSHTPVPPL